MSCTCNQNGNRASNLGTDRPRARTISVVPRARERQVLPVTPHPPGFQRAAARVTLGSSRAVHAVSPDVLREDAKLTQIAFTRLLVWLDDGIESRGERYIEMRRRLVSYFDRRGRLSADELADETLNRIGRTLEKDGVIATTPPARYCYVVAKYVLLEDVPREGRPSRSMNREAAAPTTVGWCWPASSRRKGRRCASSASTASTAACSS